METVVEVGGWEHDCCGPSYERNSVVDLDCLVLRSDSTHAVRHIESHHDTGTENEIRRLHGRIADIQIRHIDGRSEPIQRLPSGRALRGFDETDDGHLEHPQTRAPVSHDSDSFVLVVAE